MNTAERIIGGVYAALLAALVGAAFGRDRRPTLLARLRDLRAARHRWEAGDDLTAGVDAIADEDTRIADERCPRCHGRHCWAHRHGLDCGAQTAPGLTYSILSSRGLHTPRAVLARLVPADWSPLSVDVRVGLAPRHYAARLPVPVMEVAR